MADALDMLRPCPACGREMLFCMDGMICPPCNYLFCMEDGETLVQTAERFNAHWDEIARDMAEMREAERGESEGER